MNWLKRTQISMLGILITLSLTGCTRHPTGTQACDPQGDIFELFNNNKQNWVERLQDYPPGLVRQIQVPNAPVDNFIVELWGDDDNYSDMFLSYTAETNEWPATRMGTMGLVYVPGGEITRRSGLDRFELTRIQDNVYCYRRP